MKTITSTRVRASVKAGQLTLNHNSSSRVRTSVRGGQLTLNHNQK